MRIIILYLQSSETSFIFFWNINKIKFLQKQIYQLGNETKKYKIIYKESFTSKLFLELHDAIFFRTLSKSLLLLMEGNLCNPLHAIINVTYKNTIFKYIIAYLIHMISIQH